MILYSIIPAEFVFENMEDSGIHEYLEMEYLGERVIVSPLDDNQFVIDRLISTSLKAYLNPRLQPGSIIKRPDKIV